MNCVPLLCDLIKTKSEYPEEFAIGEKLEKILRESGFEVERQYLNEKRFNLLAKKGNGAKAVLFYGHMDTVPLESRNEWETDPFNPVEKDGKVFGLGAYDMKGGMAAFFEATKDVNRYIKIFIACDEENISEGAWLAVKEKKEFFGDVKLVISAEPNFGLGINSLTVGRSGRCILKVMSFGKSAHIIKASEGIDAVEKISSFLAKFYSTKSKLVSSRGLIQIRKVASQVSGMSIPDYAEAEIEVFLGPEDDKEALITKLNSLEENVQVVLKPRKTPYLNGYYFKEFGDLTEIKNTIRKSTGKEVTLDYRYSVGDDNVLATLGTPVVTWGPDGGNAHAANEYVEIENLNNLAVMYNKFISL